MALSARRRRLAVPLFNPDNVYGTTENLRAVHYLRAHGLCAIICAANDMEWIRLQSEGDGYFVDRESRRGCASFLVLRQAARP